MAFQHKINRGSMFRNTRKEEDTHPDFTGSAKIMLPGMDSPVDVWVSCWTNPPRDGKKGFFSLSFKPKEEQTRRESAQSMNDDFDDDIPF